jgi:hypothetical protein
MVGERTPLRAVNDQDGQEIVQSLLIARERHPRAFRRKADCRISLRRPSQAESESQSRASEPSIGFAFPLPFPCLSIGLQFKCGRGCKSLGERALALDYIFPPPRTFSTCFELASKEVAGALLAPGCPPGKSNADRLPQCAGELSRAAVLECLTGCVERARGLPAFCAGNVCTRQRVRRPIMAVAGSEW